MPDLLSELRSFDGKHTKSLQPIVESLATGCAEIDMIILAAESDEAKLQTAAMWVLKQSQERGVVFSPSQVNRLLGVLPAVETWEAKLLLLQMMLSWKLPKRRAALLFKTIAGFLKNESNKFLRAWCYSGVAAVADQYPQYRQQVCKIIANGQGEEAKSVQCRIRNVWKTYDWVSS